MRLFGTFVILTTVLLFCQVKGNNDCYPVSGADLNADDPTKDISRSLSIIKWPNAFSSNGLSNGGVTIWGRTKGWVTVNAGSEHLNDMNYFALDVKNGGSSTQTKYFYLKKNSDCALWYDYNDIIGGTVFKVNRRG